ncbi:MAG: capsular polysaccharide export protein, LipB/KpsS family [Candidatus Electronema sp. VV]
MNILLLSNSAPNYFHFFNALIQCYVRDNATVVIAVDSLFSRRENKLDTLGFDIYEFSEYFATHQINKNILERYSKFDLNGALLSDFDRSQVYNVWGKNITIEFYDRLKSALLTYFEEIFTRHSINLVLYENVSNTFAHFALFVAQNKEAVYLGISSSRLPGRFKISSDPIEDNTTKNVFEAIQSGHLVISDEVRQWTSEYIAKIETIVPDYMKINGLDRIDLVSRYFVLNKFKKMLSLFRHTFDSRTDAFQVGNPLITHFNLFRRNILRRIKIRRVAALYQKAVSNDFFLLYPLHFHPESSTSILAGTYLDEYEVIRNIAFSLPEGIRLYVKDHVSAWGYPSLDFYRRIRNLPNVRLLGPNEPTKHLIKQSVGVITITSTVGYEALLLKTRVYLYGRVFYEFHKGVIRIENPAKLRKTLLDGMATPIDWDDSYNDNFLCAYYLTTLPGTLNLMQEGKKAHSTAQNIYEVLKSQKMSSGHLS